MSLHYIIDGYNIINHPHFLRKTPRRNLSAKEKFCFGTSESRVMLLEFVRLNLLSKSSRHKITVVFDGYPQTGSLSVDTDIRVIFSRQESADEKIKRIVEGSLNRKNIVVVSDDKEIKFFAKSIGTKALGVEEFISSTAERRQRSRDNEKGQNEQESSFKSDLTYSQMHEINQELKKIWLK